MSPTSNKRKRGAPPGNTNARRHGYYSQRRSAQATRDGDASAPAVAISPPPDGAAPGKPAPIPTQEDLILSLYRRQAELLKYLSHLNGNPDLAPQRIAAEALYTKNVSVLSRMLRHVQTGDRSLTDALNVALDAMAKELGVQL